MLVSRSSQPILLMLCALTLVLGGTVVEAQTEQGYEVRILHTNDHHAHIEPVTIDNRLFGGVARRKTLIDRARTEGGNLVLLDAGNVLQGTLYFDQHKLQADLFFYNAMQYDAMALGNHELEAGQQALVDFVTGASFPILSANIAMDGTSPLAGQIQPYVIKELNGERIGIIGLTAEDTAAASNSGPGITLTSPIEAAQQTVNDLTAQGINKIIALSNLGHDLDRGLAQQVTGIDVIVGGHSRTSPDAPSESIGEYPVVETAPDSNRVLVVQSREWGMSLGDLRVTFDTQGVVQNWNGEPIPVDDSIASDPMFQAKIAEYAAPVEQDPATVIGQSTVLLDGEATAIRSRETNLGSLIADAMLEKGQLAGAQIALINSGSIHASIDPGDITAGKVREVLPSDDTVVLLEVTGAQIKDALENGVSQFGADNGRFPQVAGMRYIFNPANAVGSRITNVELMTDQGLVPIDPVATYRLVTTRTLANGDEGYGALGQTTNRIDSEISLSAAVNEYIAVRSPVNPVIEGRIIQIVFEDILEPSLTVLPEVPLATAPQPRPTTDSLANLEDPPSMDVLPKAGSETLPSDGLSPDTEIISSPEAEPSPMVPHRLPDTGETPWQRSLLIALGIAALGSGMFFRRTQQF